MPEVQPGALHDKTVAAPPCTMVIFGAAGDLTKRLLIPSIYHLRVDRRLPDDFSIIGVARADETDESFRQQIGSALSELGGAKPSADDWRWLSERLSYIRGDFDDAKLYEAIKAKVDGRAKGNCIFYLATPPSQFAPVVEKIGESGLAREDGGRFRRVVIEKPFGTDLPSARALNARILKVLDETQIYRIDHYLGKETVQNIMVLRFANGLFEPVWNRDHIDHVEITVAETVNVERRGAFYDATGALRDMVPNHLFQVLTLIGMEPPSCFDADALRSEKTKLLNAIHLTQKDAREHVVRGQYEAGDVEGKPVVAYREAPDVPRDSRTETYVAMTLKIDNWRWAGVPFYLRTGKALARRRTEVAIHFKKAPLALFRDTPIDRMKANFLVIHLSPDEGVSLRFNAKEPGPRMEISGVDMKFDYQDYFSAKPRTGYETLIYDCMVGDATLFQRADNIESGWRVVQPILDLWAAEPDAPLAAYPAGGEGPGESAALLSESGRAWRSIAAPTGGAPRDPPNA